MEMPVIWSVIILKRIFKFSYKYCSRIFDLYFFFKRIIFVNKKKYKIIPLGVYCLPRCIAAYSKLKPLKSEGELSCPFDLVYYKDFDKIIELIDTHFQNFYSGLEFDKDKNWWFNNEIAAVFNHERGFSREKFEERYSGRIKNFYEYMNSKDYHIYFLIATFPLITSEQADSLLKVLKKYRNENDFDVIIINQGSERNLLKRKNVHIIEQAQNYDIFRLLNVTPGAAIQALNRRDTIKARKIYNEITSDLIDIIANN